MHLDLNHIEAHRSDFFA